MQVHVQGESKYSPSLSLSPLTLSLSPSLPLPPSLSLSLSLSLPPPPSLSLSLSLPYLPSGCWSALIPVRTACLLILLKSSPNISRQDSAVYVIAM